jgi:hypothetical protein
MKRSHDAAAEYFADLWPKVARITLGLYRLDRDPEERLAEARALLWEGCLTTDKPVLFVRRRLIDRIRTEARHDRILKRVGVDPDSVPYAASGLWLLLIDAPDDLKTLIRLALEEGRRYYGVKGVIRKRLKKLGWPARRIKLTWRLVREALT